MILPITPRTGASIFIVAALSIVALVMWKFGFLPPAHPFKPQLSTLNSSATPWPRVTPNPEFVTERTWLEPALIDAAGTDTPDNLFFLSANEPIVTKEGERWKITFKK